MPVHSSLRPSKERVAQLVSAYAHHRPVIQRALTTGFIVYVVSTTYRGLSARPASSASLAKRKGKGKDADGGAGKPRVAVSACPLLLAPSI